MQTWVSVLQSTERWKNVLEVQLTDYRGNGNPWMGSIWGTVFIERVKKLMGRRLPFFVRILSVLRRHSEMQRAHRGESRCSLKYALHMQSQKPFNKINTCYSWHSRQRPTGRRAQEQPAKSPEVFRCVCGAAGHRASSWSSAAWDKAKRVRSKTNHF